MLLGYTTSKRAAVGATVDFYNPLGIVVENKTKARIVADITRSAFISWIPES
jgi:hypothetical protein